jgi:type III pantothenate kinase
MAWLLVDNSNTRTKFALGDSSGLHDWRAVIPTCDVTPESLDETLREIVFSGAIVCSVVPKKAAILKGFLETLSRHGAPAIIIDFGTAVTFDVISDQPAYCGGAIAPGLGAMSGYLPQKTALLPAIELVEPATAIGKSTEQAMQAGAVFGYRGLVREIIARIRTELHGHARIIATGGDAALIARGVPEIDAVDADITLDGLRQVAARVFP